MPYYTGAGDTGETGICDEGRLKKSSPRVKAIGDVDELNSALGVCRAACKDKDIIGIINEVQGELFILGSDLAAPAGSKTEGERILPKHTKRVECEIDGVAKEVGDLKCFILPGGTDLAARLHFARAVCRRTERTIVALSEKENINGETLRYTNRLSSLLFVLARMANERAKVKDIEWPPAAPKKK
jgi:cob(I)alamin adenosyltransferase